MTLTNSTVKVMSVIRYTIILNYSYLLTSIVVKIAMEMIIYIF